MNFLFVELVLLGNRKQTKYGEAYDDKFNDNSCKDSSFFVMIAHLFKSIATTRKKPTIWAHTPIQPYMMIMKKVTVSDTTSRCLIIMQVENMAITMRWITQLAFRIVLISGLEANASLYDFYPFIRISIQTLIKSSCGKGFSLHWPRFGRNRLGFQLRLPLIILFAAIVNSLEVMKSVTFQNLVLFFHMFRVVISNDTDSCSPSR